MKIRTIEIAVAILCSISATSAPVHQQGLRSGNLRNASLHGGSDGTREVSLHQHMASMPCACQSSSNSWKRTTRTQPQCIFIDLGAADGNSFAAYLKGNYGPVANCPSGVYEAYLVEANPGFQQALEDIERSQLEAGKAYALAPEAAYMCQGETSFYLDTVNQANNYWGSSMSHEHPDVQKSGQQKVTVPTVNVIQLVAEHAIPGDWVTVKMDIEGAEWDILPCLANSPDAALIDELLIEIHPSNLGLAGTTEAQMDAAIAKLKSMGVRVPKYFSGTL